jgi:hypothetical protein
MVPLNRSFNASHSEFYWFIEAKVDIDDRRDIHVKQVIQVLFSIREKANGEDMVERWTPLCENIGYNTIITH